MELKLKGLKKLSSETKNLSGYYSGKYIQVNYDPKTNEIWGDAWMEEFDNYGECVLWLLGVVNAQGEPTDDNDKPINEYFK